MRRRTVIAGLPLALTGWPVAAQALAQGRVAALWPFPPGDAEGLTLSSAFRVSMREQGQPDIQIDDRWGGADRNRTRALASDLVATKPQAILTYLSAQLTAVSALTREIPIVFVGASDPVGFGYVVSRQRPGGNITGFTLYEPPLGGKWLAALKEAVPTIRHVKLLSNPSSGAAGANFYSASFSSTAADLGVRASIATVDEAAAVEPLIAELGQEGDAGLIVAPGTFSEANGDHIVALTARYRIPAVFAIRRFAHRGGLMSYGPDPTEAVHRAGAYVARIVRGDNPATLPVQAPTKYDFIVNLKTARTLGLTISSALLAQADEIVE